MTIDIVVPALGESVTEATVAKWLKTPGQTVRRDEVVVELETDKVNLEITAQTTGTLAEVVAREGANVPVGAVLGRIQEGPVAAQPAQPAQPAKAAPAKPADAKPRLEVVARPDAQTKPAAPAATPQTITPAAAPQMMAPAARKLVADHGLDAGQLRGSGRDGRVLKSDVLAAVEAKPAQLAPAPRPSPAIAPPAPMAAGERREPMSRLRRRIAQRLKEAQNTAAMLTTFNELDMSAVMALRAQFRDSFEKKHGVKLGFMSFFVKAAVTALKEQPLVNARIDGDDIVYNVSCHIGVAVGAAQGLVVPVVRNAERLGFAEIEKMIGNFGQRARDGKLTLDELAGGTFTISNGGIYGSLLSTPILNPPQAAILGMHKIQPRPVAIGDKVEVRPMMYLALSYDHRLIDGREAVTFLLRIKDCVEDPQRIMLDV